MKKGQAIERKMAEIVMNTRKHRRVYRSSPLRKGEEGGSRRPGRRPAMWLLAGALMFVPLFALTWNGQRAEAQAPAPPMTVNQPDDAGDGVCDATCTLRDAVLAANATPGADVINFDPALTAVTLEGEISIAGAGGALAINGNGAKIFTIHAGGNVNRIFLLDAADVTITDVTLTGGTGTGTFFEPVVGGTGGAIAGYACTLLLDRVDVTGNTADSEGGAINIQDGNLRIRNSAVSHNVAPGCGGINVGGPNSSLEVVNSTISNNWATSGTGVGGGVCTAASASFRNVTITGNRANRGGGIFQTANTLSLVNTIVSGNTADLSFPEIFLQGGTVNSAGFNLIGDSSGDAAGTGLPVMFQGADILDTPPLLLPLGDYGGPTPTHAIQPGSPVIDAGRQAFAIDLNGSPLQTDQRGNGFPRLVGNGVDVGAFEVQAPPPPPPTPAPDLATSFVVNSAGDPGAGGCDATECTLREAVAAANGDAGAETITFDPAAFAAPGPHTINLSGALPELSSDMTIRGLGASVLTVRRDTGGEYRIFTVGTPATVTISGLTISNGRAMGNTPDDSGGGILNLGTLTLSDSTVSGNKAFFCGGGICNWGSSATAHVINSRVTNNESDFNGGGIENRSTLTVQNSTVSGNTARWDGGGIQNANLVATACHVINSTVSENTAVSGGGIYSGSPLTLTSSTVSGNRSAGEGGGIYVHLGPRPLLQNSIVADNYLGETTTENDIAGPGPLDSSSSFNLIGTGGGGLTNGANNNLVGVADPGLGPLAPNGGPTETHALQSGSPAVDAGNSFGLATDQRGSVRPFDLASIPNASGGSDIGAHEFGSPASWAAAALLGTNVTVTAGPVTVNFSGVTQMGVTTVTEIDPATAGALPGGYSLGPGLPAYEITTTAQYTPPVTVCVGVPSVNDAAAFAALRILHGEGGVLVDRTVLPPDSPAPDFSTRTLCARVDSLSPFVVAQYLSPNPTPTPPTDITSLVVNSTDDPSFLGDGVCTTGAGGCTLREAIDAANADSGTEAITFDIRGTGPHTIQLTQALPALSGGVDILNTSGESITVSGEGAADSYRIFTINAGQTVNISGLIISNGNMSGLGGGVYNEGTLTLTSCTVSGNLAGNGYGGGVYNVGTLTLTDSAVSGNTATHAGGGILNSGALTLTNSTVGSNAASLGGGIYTNVGTANLTNSTVSGNIASFWGGGGIHNSATLSLTNSTVSGNSARDGGGIYNTGMLTMTEASTVSGNISDHFGGGIHNSGTLNITNSTVSHNVADYPYEFSEVVYGGGIYNVGTLNITNSTVGGNTAVDGRGGGIYTHVGTLTLSNSTVSGNVGTYYGGGIYNEGTLYLANGTVSGNSAYEGLGGGIYNKAGTVNVTNSTVSGNIASFWGGGGIHNSGSPNLLLLNSIVAGNYGVHAIAADIAGDPVHGTSSFNLIGTGGSGGLTDGVNNNLVGVANPGLGPLASNGGPTQTHALQAGSPAIDKGNAFSLTLDPVTTDQRGRLRPVDNPTVPNAAEGSDIGAFELQAAEPTPPPTPTPTPTPTPAPTPSPTPAGATFVVNSTADMTDGACTTGAGGCTLREAIAAANVLAGADTVAFDIPGAGPHTIQLGLALPALSGMSMENTSGESITVRGEGESDPYHIFTIGSGRTVTISGLAVTDGAATGSGSISTYVGGGIYNEGTLTLTDISVSGNTAGSGGGIFNSGSLTLTNSAVRGNSARAEGGGILNYGTVNITNSTVSGNSSARYGGGIFSNEGTLTLTDSTVSGNSSTGNGGGIFNGSAGHSTLTLTNSTVSGNSSAQSGGGIYQNRGSLVLLSATITNNRADAENRVIGSGGGITVRIGDFFGEQWLLRNSIVADNYRGSGATEDDIQGVVDSASSFNLIGTGGSGGLTNGTNNNRVGVENPGLGPLALNGGPTETHALQSGSPAIDKGSAFGLSTDQRGTTRPVDDPPVPPAPGGDNADIGAFERQPGNVMSAVTPVGSDVAVQLGAVSVTFSGVSAAGITSQVSIDPATAGLLPGQYTLGPGLPAYEITTTAQYTPPVTVCIQVPAVSDPAVFAALRILHGEGGVLVDRTVLPPDSPAPDFSTRRLCARVDSLSPFVVAQLLTPAGDTTAPAVTISTPSHGATFVKGQAVAAGYSCQDEAGGSGLASCTGTVADGAPIDTSTVGSHTFTVTGADIAGNSATATSTYNVVYGFSGFLPPVENLPALNIANAGGAIPVKFSLGGNQGLAIFAAGYPASSPIPCDASEPGTLIEETVAAGSSSLSYSATTDQYNYVWKTDRSWRGTCRMLVVRFNDGAEHLAKFRFK